MKMLKAIAKIPDTVIPSGNNTNIDLVDEWQNDLNSRMISFSRNILKSNQKIKTRHSLDKSSLKLIKKTKEKLPWALLLDLLR